MVMGILEEGEARAFFSLKAEYFFIVFFTAEESIL